MGGDPASEDENANAFPTGLVYFTFTPKHGVAGEHLRVCVFISARQSMFLHMLFGMRFTLLHVVPQQLTFLLETFAFSA